MTDQPTPEDADDLDRIELSDEDLAAAERVGLLVPGTRQIDMEKAVARLVDIYVTKHLRPLGSPIPRSAVVDVESPAGAALAVLHPHLRLLHVTGRDGVERTFAAHVEDIARAADNSLN
jgi:hypothetical protein